MLSFSPIEKPKIDIELYGTDINIAPIDKVHIMDEDSFEHFTLEWLYGCKKDKYSSIMRIGGAGDKGRDVIAYRKDGGVDYFQCKHYNSALAPSNYYGYCSKREKEKCERKRIQCISELCRSDSIVKIHAKTCTLCTRINSLRFADSLFERN